MLVMKDGVLQMPVHPAISLLMLKSEEHYAQCQTALFIAPLIGKCSHGRSPNMMERGCTMRVERP
jgi:hypothetical protein